MRLSKRTSAAVAVAVGLVLSACGSTDAPEVADESIPAVTAAPTGDAPVDEAPAGAADQPADSTATGDGTESTESTESAGADAAPATDAPAVPATEQPAAVPEPEPVVAQLGGRDLGAELDPASNFEGNIFPDLLVDDIRAQAKVNVRNLFPADRPVLVWLWAPH